MSEPKLEPPVRPVREGAQNGKAPERTVVERYVVKQNETEIEVVEVNLEPLYEFAPQVTACELLRTLASAYETLKRVLEESQVIIETSPDAGVSYEGVDKESTATALAWIVKLVPYMSLTEALKFIRQFEDFDESEVVDLLKRTKRVLYLWDGYETCYAFRFKEVVER